MGSWRQDNQLRGGQDTERQFVANCRSVVLRRSNRLSCGRPMLQSRKVHEEPVAQFGFEPGGLRWHDLAGVGDGHEFTDRCGVHAEGHLPFRPNRRVVRVPPRPRMPPTKSIRPSVRGSVIPRMGERMWFCMMATSRRCTGSGCRCSNAGSRPRV
jgi:hypothetical protein